jgi:sugar phosphate isomerase/epimerase
MKIAALICFGNPLYPGKLGEEYRIEINKTLELAKVLGVKKIITMSGLPAASADEQIPLWITYNVSLSQYLQDVMKYQWEEVAIPYWKRVVEKAKACGVKRIALENFTSMLVYNPETLLKLRDAVDPQMKQM